MLDEQNEGRSTAILSPGVLIFFSFFSFSFRHQAWHSPADPPARAAASVWRPDGARGGTSLVSGLAWPLFFVFLFLFLFSNKISLPLAFGSGVVVDGHG
jgi:hypothetical protein